MSSESNKEYSVNWKNHMSHVRKAFDHLLSSSELIDVTLCCEGKKIGAHKMLLSACSTYFRDTFKDVPCQHPVIVLYGVEYGVLSDILHFIYNGEVSVDTSKLDSFLKTAQLLQISGLTDGTDATDSLNNENEHSTENSTLEQDEEETYAEAVAESSTVNDDTKRGVKRQKAKETEPLKDKITRQESETMFITDVKCEPSELVNFEDPLEDPLLQSEIQQNDSREFFAPAGTQNVAEEDFKKQTNVTKNSWPINTVKCNICDKVFSHPYSLQQHKPVHAGNTRCPICNAVLSRKYHLKLHMKARHNLI